VIHRSKSPIADDAFEPLSKFLCKDCRRMVPWYAMKRRPSVVVLEAVGGGITATLQQILFATGNRESQIVDDNDDDSTVTESGTNTAAGTNDSSDLTFDEVSHVDGILNVPASGHMETIYTVTTATFSGSIDFVRWILRAVRQDISGAPIASRLTSTTATAGFAAISHPATIKNLTTALANYTIDATTDPSDGRPWTLAKINARKYGFQMDTTNSGPPPTGAESRTRVTEFRIEVWGH